MKVSYWILVGLIVLTLLFPWTRYGAAEAPRVNVDIGEFKLEVDAPERTLAPLPFFLDRPNKEIDWQYTGIQLAVLGVILVALVAARELKVNSAP